MVTLNQYMRDVNARGFRLGEHPDYGGVTKGAHMKGSSHDTGHGVDINWGAPGIPADEARNLIWAARLAEAAKLNTIYAPYRTHPNSRTNNNHRDHLHVDDTPVSQRALKPRAGHTGDALYRKILAERPVKGSGGGATEYKKPHALATIGVNHDPDGTWREKLWQRFLKATGDYKGKIDGKFGPQTEEATKDWQKRAGLKPDGVVGPKTWFRATWGTEKGDEGVRVEIAQRVLGLTGARVDGKAGPIFDRETKEMQRDLGVDDDGKIGPKTVAAMLKRA